MKKKIILIGSMVIALVILTVSVIPVFATDNPVTTPQIVQDVQYCRRFPILQRLMLIQDEAKVDTIIARAVNAGVLTEEQAVKVKEFWTSHHSRFANKIILRRLMLIQDEAKVDAIIARAVNAEKLTEEQAVKVKEFWTKHHSQFAKKVFLTRIIWIEDGAKVQGLLDNAIANGRINEEQADRIMTLWNKLHTE